MVSVPLDLLKRMHKAEYAERIAHLNEDELLAQKACSAFEAAISELYELMAEALPANDPAKQFV